MRFLTRSCKKIITTDSMVNFFDLDFFRGIHSISNCDVLFHVNVDLT